MNILLVSQCSKRALPETRRIIDQFAQRCGDKTWQTAITKLGLSTLRKLLRKSARKNTAVACHWIRSKNHTELLWIVGNAKLFNEHGSVPTQTSSVQLLRHYQENDWHSLEDIKLLAKLAALFHDFGKANVFFQKKLTQGKKIADAYRHEWVSLRLFEALVANDDDQVWLQRLISFNDKTIDPAQLDITKHMVKDGIDRRALSPFKSMPPLAQLVGWLIVSHHFLPAPKQQANSEVLNRLPETIESDWGAEQANASEQQIQQCWQFKKALPLTSHDWRRRAARVAQAILKRPDMWQKKDWFNDPYPLHIARMSLMLADHFYSAQTSTQAYGDSRSSLYANTDSKTGKCKQRLDEHLIGVAINAGKIVRSLPNLNQQLPRIARHKGFRQRTRKTEFQWQNQAFDLALGLQQKTIQQGFFGINMASTGCGKTFANARILYGLADPTSGARFSIALGLRTLTLQTGNVYRQHLGLDDDDMAVLVGGSAVRDMHNYYQQANLNHSNSNHSNLAQAGSESAESLMADSNHVHYHGSLADGPLNRWLKQNAHNKNRSVQKLIQAPILVCTIDHLITATEACRGGRQIPAMLRLLSSDIVLDEPDDFAIEDLAALSRFVHFCGLLGSRVLLSSATLPPALVEGLFNAYRQGRKSYQANRGSKNSTVNVCCAWFDEFNVDQAECAHQQMFATKHQEFVAQRRENLQQQANKEVRRKAEIKPVNLTAPQSLDSICQHLATTLRDYSLQLHHQHQQSEPLTGKHISFGLIRMANIEPLYKTAKYLYQLGASENTHIHLCVYHSQHPLLVRQAIEYQLDNFLQRKQAHKVLSSPELQGLIAKSPQKHHLFIVIATAVAEVGRDHDYDWAIIEPSSMRSIIQLAGRVRRHRHGNIANTNIYILDHNVRHLKQGLSKLAFCRPGFESDLFKLKSHDVNDLILAEQLQVINSCCRIAENTPLDHSHSLINLEHKRLRNLMTNNQQNSQDIPINRWWQTAAHLSAALQNWQRFRNNDQGKQLYALSLNDDDEIQFCRLEKQGQVTHCDNLLHPENNLTGADNISAWATPDNYQSALQQLAEDFNMDPRECARKFGVIELSKFYAEQGWYYHPALGFSKKH